MKALDKLIKRSDKSDLYFFLFLPVFFIISLFLLNIPPSTDEGTHSLIALFFRDLINDLIKYPSLSFSNVYDYTISYLVHYPKLSLYYPPLLHVIVSFFYKFLGASFFIGRLVVLFFAIGTLMIMYKTFQRFLDKRSALLATILFSIMPMIYYNSITMMTDIPYMFFFMFAMYFYLTALDSKKKMHFILASIVTSLAFLTKWNSILIVPIILVYTILEKREQIKNVIMSIVLILLIISPYLLLVWKTGLISIPFISSLQVSATAKQDPQFTTVQGLTYYLNVLTELYFTMPFLVASILALMFYSFKKENYWKLLITWFLTFYMFFTVLSNKEPRYMIPLIPALLIPLSHFIVSQKAKIAIPVIIISFVFLLSSTWQLISSTFYYPDFTAVAEKTLKSEGNILIAAEPGWFYSSQFIFTLASIDEHMSKFVYRPCSLFSTPLDNLLSNYGIKYVIVPEPADRDFDNVVLVKSSPILKLDKEFRAETVNVSLYANSNYTPQKKYCNFICVINATICIK